MPSENQTTDLMCFMPIGPTSDRESSMSATPERTEYERFYTAYGECFSAWSGVELNLLAIFVFLLNSPDYEAASSAFYSTTGFRAKLEMVNATVNNSKRVAEEDLKAWRNIYETTSKSSQRRNQLAHNTVYFGRQSDKEQRKMFIGHPRTPYESSRLHVHDLKQIRDSFASLGGEIFSFWRRLLPRAQNA
ncbi:MAG: hypothetical protein ACREBU_19320 [Nitrososphaera sp.]